MNKLRAAMSLIPVAVSLTGTACRGPEPTIETRQSALGAVIGRATKVSAGYSHSCALLSTGGVVCWGFGTLGNGSTATTSVPVVVVGLSDAVDVSAGAYHTCAVRRTGEVVCWGWNGIGQPTSGSVLALTPVAVPGLTDARSVSAGAYHTCAVRSGGGVACWGWGANGRLGNGSNADSSVPVAVSGLSDAAKVAAGYYHACALRTGGGVVCWGRGGLGALGNGASGDSNVPVAVSGLTDAGDIAVGNSFGCASHTTGQQQMVCWGYGADGRLGNGGSTSSSVPVGVSGLTAVKAVTAGGGHACALRATGQVFCWGSNGDGWLGNGTTSPSSVPVAVTGLVDATQVVTGGSGLGTGDGLLEGGDHSCAVRQSGQVVCWGSAGANGAASSSTVPVTVANLADLVCTSGVDCASGFCVDGVCCNVACGGGNPNDCQACSVAAGASSDGVCGPRAAATVCYARDHLCASMESSLACGGVALTCAAPTPWPRSSCVAANSTTDIALGDGTDGGVILVTLQEPFSGEIAARSQAGCAPAGAFLLMSNLPAAGGPRYWTIGTEPRIEQQAAEICFRYDQSWFGPESPMEAAIGIARGDTATEQPDGSCDPAAAGWAVLVKSRPVDTSNNFVCVGTNSLNSSEPPPPGGGPDGGVDGGGGQPDAGPTGAPIGAPCATVTDCVSGASCTDGVCCGSPCGDSSDDDCQVCSTAKGAVANGTCTFLDATHMCRDSSGDRCDLGGFCAGAADCPANKPATTPCYVRPPGDQCAAQEATVACGDSLTCPGPTDWPTHGCETQDGTSLKVTLNDGAAPPGTVTVQFSYPWDGTISVTRATGCPPATGFTFPTGADPTVDPASIYWDLNPDPALDCSLGDVEVCVTYPQSWFGPVEDPMEAQLQLRHGNANAQIDPDTCDPARAGWAYLPPSQKVDTDKNIVCANTCSLSPFALMIPSGVDQLPTLQLPGPIVAHATSAAGAVVTYAASATDARDGALVPTCVPAAGSVFPLGQTTVRCNVSDSDHLTADGAFTVWVQVQARTDGAFFLPPINPDGSSIFKGGTIPVKFKLAGASAAIANLTARLFVAKVSSGVSGTDVEPTSTCAADGGNLFRYDPGDRQYIFNLSTKPLSSGTWSLRADLGDGVTHQVNVSVKGAR